MKEDFLDENCGIAEKHMKSKNAGSVAVGFVQDGRISPTLFLRVVLFFLGGYDLMSLGLGCFMVDFFSS